MVLYTLTGSFWIYFSQGQAASVPQVQFPLYYFWVIRNASFKSDHWASLILYIYMYLDIYIYIRIHTHRYLDRHIIYYVYLICRYTGYYWVLRPHDWIERLSIAQVWLVDPAYRGNASDSAALRALTAFGRWLLGERQRCEKLICFHYFSFHTIYIYVYIYIHISVLHFAYGTLEIQKAPILCSAGWFVTNIPLCVGHWQQDFMEAYLRSVGSVVTLISTISSARKSWQNGLQPLGSVVELMW